MQEINLLKNQLKDSRLNWDKHNRLLIVGLVVFLIIEIAGGAVLFTINRSQAKSRDTVTAGNVQIQNKLNAKQNELGPAKAFQAQLTNLNRLVESHLYWTNFFDELTKVTLKKAQFTQLQADTIGKVYVEGRSANYSDLGKLLLGLSTSKHFSKVRLLSSNPGTGEISGLIFTLEFRINPELLNETK